LFEALHLQNNTKANFGKKTPGVAAQNTFYKELKHRCAKERKVQRFLSVLRKNVTINALESLFNLRIAHRLLAKIGTTPRQSTENTIDKNLV
jgi:hypothetical protein